MVTNSAESLLSRCSDVLEYKRNAVRTFFGLKVHLEYAPVSSWHEVLRMSLSAVDGKLYEAFSVGVKAVSVGGRSSHRNRRVSTAASLCSEMVCR